MKRTDWRKRAEKAIEAAADARASASTLRHHVAERDLALREQERTIAVLEGRLAAVERDLADAKAHPLIKAREREELPDIRHGLAIKLRVNGIQGKRCATCGARDPDSPPVTSLLLHLGFYADGRLGEMFVRLDRDRRADVASAFADEWATVVSYALQHGLPVEWPISKARHVRDGSGGVPYVWDGTTYVRHPVIHHCSSVVDYIAAVVERVLSGKPATTATDDEIREAA